MNHLADCNYISDLKDLRKVKATLQPDLKAYITQLEKFDKTKNYQKNSSLELDPLGPAGFLDEYIAPELLLPKRGPPLSFTEEEFRLVITCNLDVNLQSISFEEYLSQIAKLIGSPRLAKKYVLVSQLHNFTPFLIDGKVVCWNEIDFNKRIPDQQFLQKNLESIEKGALFFKQHGGLSAFNKKLKDGSLDPQALCELAKLAESIAWPLDQIHQQNLDDQTHTFLEIVKIAKDLKPLVKLEEQVKNLSRLKDRKQEIERLKFKLEKTGLDSLTKNEFQLLLEISYSKQTFPGSLLQIPNINSHIPVLQQLEDIGGSLHQAAEAIFQNRNSPRENYPKDLKEFFKVVDKIEIAYTTKQQGLALTKAQKLSLKEYYLYKKYQGIFDFNKDFREINEQFKTLVSRNEKKPFISVSLFKTRAHIEENFPIPSTLEKIGKLTNILAAKVFFKYNHANFLEFDGETFSKHGLWNEGIYHTGFSVNWSPKTRDCRIVVDALIPKNLPPAEKEAFERFFFTELKVRINAENDKVKFPANSYRRFFGIGIPSEKKTPSDIRVKKRKEIFCSQFICETIIEAHVATCKTLGYDPPASLTFYGLKENENLPALTPSKLYKKFLKSGIFKEQDNPLFR